MSATDLGLGQLGFTSGKAYQGLVKILQSTVFLRSEYSLSFN